MYRVLPFIAAVNLALPDFSLPPELWSMILRNLDPASLIAAVRTSPHWMRIARGDPILRDRIRQEVRRKEEIRQEEMMNPGSMMAVIREGPAKLFQAVNGSKKVKCRPNIRPHTRNDPVIQVIAEEYKQRNAGGKIRRAKEARCGPMDNNRKVIRC